MKRPATDVQKVNHYSVSQQKKKRIELFIVYLHRGHQHAFTCLYNKSTIAALS